MPEEPIYYTALSRIHRMLTRGLNVIVDNSLVFAESGFRDKLLLVGFFRYVKSFLVAQQTHHLMEDEAAFPFFRQHVPSLRLDGLNTQHRQMVPLREEIKTLIEKIAENPENRELPTQLATTATNLRVLWNMHISAEEAYFTSVAVTTAKLTKEEEGSIVRKAIEYNQKYCQPAAWTVPFILYNLEAEDRAQMAATMPQQLVRVLVPIVWKNEWGPMKPFLLD
jgi:hemerythrin-like domain-containing protein